jgi:hypothetical protein
MMLLAGLAEIVAETPRGAGVAAQAATSATALAQHPCLRPDSADEGEPVIELQPVCRARIGR